MTFTIPDYELRETDKAELEKLIGKQRHVDFLIEEKTPQEINDQHKVFTDRVVASMRKMKW